MTPALFGLDRFPNWGWKSWDPLMLWDCPVSAPHPGFPSLAVCGEGSVLSALTGSFLPS